MLTLAYLWLALNNGSGNTMYTWMNDLHLYSLSHDSETHLTDKYFDL